MDRYYVKNIRLEKDSIPPYDKWLEREVELQELAHKIYPYVPEIVRIDGTKIVMERVNGVTLKDYFLQGGFRDKSLLRKIIGILTLFHRNNLLHGDTNLDNYIIDNKGNIWVIDFGLSSISNDSRKHKRELEKLERNIKLLTAMILAGLYNYNPTKRDLIWFQQEFGMSPEEYIELM